MRDWLDKSALVLSHGNLKAKWQFTFWSIWHKTLFCIFIYTYTMQHNWQLHYFLTLLTNY